MYIHWSLLHYTPPPPPPPSQYCGVLGIVLILEIVLVVLVYLQRNRVSDYVR